MDNPTSSRRGCVSRKYCKWTNLFLVVAASIVYCPASRAQAVPQRRLINSAIDENNLTVLRGNTYPLARPEFDRGPAPESLALHRMILVLKRSPEQETALETLLDQQQDKASPNYHQWLTPSQFGQQFGPADEDVQSIKSWLASHGFEVARVSNGRTLIEFSGTMAQVSSAFHTEIHKYHVNGEDHWANASDPQIPAALIPGVAGVRSLHNFFPKPLNHFAGTFHRDAETGKILPTNPPTIPQFNPGGGFQCGILRGPCEALGPFDLATIYNIAPLWNGAAPIDGTGQTIAIVGETDINPSDWTAFWNQFGIATPKGTLNIIHDGPAPGILQDGEEGEADIDTQWSSAAAKGATIDFVISESTEMSAGVDLSAEYIVDNNLAPVISDSYGLCELFLGTAGNAFFNAIWQQASAQGITVFVASGDEGSAGCDVGQPYAQNGLAVSGLASTPYNVAVGGTDFNDLTTTATYWNAVNNANQANAKGYIPEMTWNDTCTNSEIFPFFGTTTADQTCNNINAQNDGFVSVAGGSGGVSSCTTSDGQSPSSCSGGYAKPPWQTGMGVPADGKRDMPDVSIFASNGFNDSFYIICESDVTGPCNLNGGSFSGFGGTSVSSPVFAGIMALVNQKTGERQGNANYVFYKMAGGAGNSCNSNSVPITGSNSCVFYDIPTGSTIDVPCHASTPNCALANLADTFGVLTTSMGVPGYNTTAGYDLATGLGSVNVTNLVNQWSTFAGQFNPTMVNPFTLGPPTTVSHGQPVPVAATVKPQIGAGTPTGTISLIANTGSAMSGQQAVQQLFTLTNGSLSAGTTTTMLPGGTNFTVKVHYSGDSTFAPSDSAPFTMTVNPEASKSQPEVITFNRATGQITNSNATSFTYGTPALLRADVTKSSGNLCSPNGIAQYGCPTGTVNLTDTFKGATGPIDAGTYKLNSEAYAEDQALFLFGGQHSIVASYGGDNSYLPSNNSTAPDVVTVSPTPTTITLASNQPMIQTGSFAILTATVSSQIFVPSGSPSFFPSNNVQFLSGSNPVSGQISYVPGSNPTAQLVAILDTNTLPIGNTTITGQFLGDSNYAASAVSNSVTIDVVIPTTTTIMTSNPSVQHGSSVTFTATVTPNQAGGPAIAGTVQFWINCVNCVPIGSMNVVNGQAQLSTSTLPGGTLTIIASYTGNVDYANSSAGLSETVNLLPTITTISTSNPAIQQGQSVTLTAHVAPVQAGGPALTGTVQFFTAISLTGSQNTIGGPVALSNGQAQFTTSSLPANIQFVGAGYPGDSNYASSIGTTAQTVAPAPDFSMATNPATIVVPQPGATGNTMVTFTALNGLTGTFNLAPQCSSLPSESSCSVMQPSITLSSTLTSATATLVISTMAPSSAAPGVRNRPKATGSGIVVAYSVLALVWLLSLRRQQRRVPSLVSLFVILALLTFASCGGGGGGGGGGNPGTPVGLDPNALVTFTLGSNTHTIPIPVNVQ